MVLGLSRMQPRSARPPITPLPSDAAAPSAQEENWLAQRGAILFEATCDVMGGFPGFADQGGELSGVALRISERFLLVDDARPNGFGIPVNWLDGAELISEGERDDPDLRVFYADGDALRCFSIRFRANRLAMRGGKRAERAQDALRAAGLVDMAPPEPPNFALPWERTREFDGENVIWTGHASAPVRVGHELAPSEIWLSTESLIWGSSEGSGLNRVTLPELSDFCTTRLKDRLGTPAIYLAVAGDQFGRYEIPFVFDQQETPDRNFRDRGAMLVGLRSRAVPEGAPTPLWQPWRLDVHPASRQVEPEPAITQAIETPTETPGVRARIESWLPRLQSLATRGLALPSVEDEESTVVAFTPADPESLPVIPTQEGSLRRNEPTVILSEVEGPLAVRKPSVSASEPEQALTPSPSPNVERGEHEGRGGEDEGCLTTRDPSRVGMMEGKATSVDSPVISSEAEGTLVEVNAPSSEAAPSPMPGEGSMDPAFVAEDFSAVPELARDEERLPSASPPPQPSPVRGGGSTASITREPVTAEERFETAALGVLADALQAIDIRLETGSLEPLSRTASLSAARDAAFTEIRELATAKTIKKREMRRRIERLTNLHDAGVRLRSIVELYDRGRLNHPELAH
jgi:hypothetical protein